MNKPSTALHSHQHAPYSLCFITAIHAPLYQNSPVAATVTQAGGGGGCRSGGGGGGIIIPLAGGCGRRGDGERACGGCGCGGDAGSYDGDCGEWK